MVLLLGVARKALGVVAWRHGGDVLLAEGGWGGGVAASRWCGGVAAVYCCLAGKAVGELAGAGGAGWGWRWWWCWLRLLLLLLAVAGKAVGVVLLGVEGGADM